MNLARRFTQLRRDLLSLTSPLRGEVARPSSPRDGSGWPAPRGPGQGGLARRRLRLVAALPLTPEAVELRFEPLDGPPPPWRPGQFLTLEVELGGQRLRRAYSLCGPPGTLHVGVKRVAGGRVSTHLTTALAPGDELLALGPSGDYGLAPDPGARREVLLIAGGSGITPQLAVLRALLEAEPHSRLTLLYGNRGPGDVMFAEALDALAEAHPGRFTLRHVLEAPPPGWGGGVGRLDAPTLARELDALAPGPEVIALSCGPEPVLRAADEALAARGVPPERRQQERFTAAPAAEDLPLPSGPLPLTLRGEGPGRVAVANPGQSLLEAGLAAGLDLPYSCAMGGCGACRMRLRAGEVQMQSPNCLSAAERARGDILTCVSFALTPVTLERPA